VSDHRHYSDEAILVAIKDYIASRGYAPSVRDLQAACGVQSTSTVEYHLRRLERDRRISRTALIARSTVVVRSS
jgi:repressor LexA